MIPPRLLGTLAAISFSIFPAVAAAQSASAQSAAAQSASSTNWTQFRGPAFNPAAENLKLPERWSVSENIAWSIEVPGRGWSSPIVVDGKVLLTTVITDGESKEPQTGTDYSNEYVAELMKQGLSEEEVERKVMERDFELPDQVSLHYQVLCFDLASGSQLWKHEYHAGKPPGGRHRKNSFASETPVTDGKLIYVYATHLGLFAYDLDGNQVWKKEIAKHPIYMEFGTGASPVLVEDKLVVLDDNQEESTITAYSTKDGSQVWQTKRTVPDGFPEAMPRSGWSTPYVWQNERTEIVTVGPGVAISYDTDGNELWRVNGMTPAPSASSFAYDGLLYLNGGKGKPIFAIRPGASGDISLAEGEQQNEFIAWVAPRIGTYIPTPVAYQGALYVVQDKGIVLKVDAKTGDIEFKERLSSSGGADFTASPWAYNGKVFCASEQGETFVFEAADEFNLVRVNRSDELIMATPAIAGDKLLLRTATKLFCIGDNG